MKTVLKLLLVTILLASLNACVVAPAYPGYVQPGATIMVPAPYPYYGPAYYGGFGIEYHRRWRRH